MFRKKKVEEICNNCRLYNREKSTCRVAVFHAGKQIHVPVDPGDTCFFEGTELLEEIKQYRFWVEDPMTGERSSEGVVKVEFPEE